MMEKCAHCGAPAVHQFKNGIYSCSKSSSGCPELQKKKKATSLAKHGVENYRNVKKSENTKLEKYGSATFNNRTQAKSTCEELYGVNNVSKLSEVKDKKENTLLENFGVSHNSQIPGHHDKMKETCLEKYGDDTFNNREQAKITCQEKYGVDNVMQLDSTKEKSRETCLEKYGVEYPLQNPEIHKKTIANGFKHKKYTMPSGKVISIQGFENFALDFYLSKFDESDIITDSSKMPSIWYNNPCNGKTHRYFPDLYIQSLNKIIEVKSNYTYNAEAYLNSLKKDACIRDGLNFEFFVTNGKTNPAKNITEIITYSSIEDTFYKNQDTQ
jgi:hypothetical protein